MATLVDLCRTCAGDSQPMIQIFGDVGRRKKLRDKISKCLSVTVNTDDARPKQICEECIINLEFAHNLFESSVKAEKLFDDFLHVVAAESDSDSDEVEFLEDMDIAPPSPWKEQEARDPGADIRFATQEIRHLQSPEEDEVPTPSPSPSYLDKPDLSPADSMSCDPDFSDIPELVVMASCSKCLHVSHSKEELDEHMEEMHSREAKMKRMADAILTPPVTAPTAGNSFLARLKSNLSAKLNPIATSSQDTTDLDDAENSPPVLEDDTPAIEEGRKKKRYPTCKKCGESFKTKKGLWIHALKVHDAAMNCDKCEECITGFDEYNAHVERHRREDKIKRLQCKYCDHVAETAKSLMLHNMKLHKEHLPKYVCLTCGKIYYARYLLKNHEKAHAMNDACLCSICGASCSTASILRTHMVKHRSAEDLRRIECHVCFKLVIITNYETHMYSHVKISPYKCEVCNKGFMKKDGLQAHELRHSKNPDSFCGICQQQFDDGLKFLIHISDHEKDPGSYVCPMCKASFPEFEELNEHANAHPAAELRALRKKNSPFTTYECSECDQVFFSQSLLDNHMSKKHTSKELDPDSIRETLKCNVCLECFSDVPSFVSHRQTHPEAFLLKCRFCERRFSSKSSCSDHLQSHKDQFNFKCDMCSDSFLFEDQLLRHQIRSHIHRENPVALACQHCDQFFMNQTSLIAHLKSHPDAQIYTCGYCGKGYRWKESCEAHVRRYHETTKNYSCKYCSFVTYRYGNLRHHEYRHTGNYPFSCDLCGKGCAINSELRKHIRKVHPGMIPFECNGCGQRFSRKSQLQKHCKRCML